MNSLFVAFLKFLQYPSAFIANEAAVALVTFVKKVDPQVDVPKWLNVRALLGLIYVQWQRSHEDGKKILQNEPFALLFTADIHIYTPL